jgi:hypothetical protein
LRSTSGARPASEPNCGPSRSGPRGGALAVLVPVALLASAIWLAGCGDSGGGFVDDALETPDSPYGAELLELYELSDLRDCRPSDRPTDPGDAEPFVDTVTVELTRKIGRVAGPSSPVYVLLPDDLSGVSIVAEAGAGSTVIVPVVDDEIVRVPSAEPDKARTLNFPFDERSDFAGRCLAFYPALVGGAEGDEIDVHIITRFQDAPQPALAVNLVVVGDTNLTDEELDDVTAAASRIYTGNRAPEIVADGIYRVDGDSIVDDEGDALDGLRARSFGEDPFAINVIFLRGFLDEGVLGFAGGVPGPAGVPTSASAVVLAVDSHLDGDGELNLEQLASTLAHELGHQLGLFHTSEAEGDLHDPIDDTPECTEDDDDDGDGELSVEECLEQDGANLMFYTSADDPQTELSPVQVELLNAHPMAF